MPSVRADWGTVKLPQLEGDPVSYELVGPGHRLYSYFEPHDGRCIACGFRQQYLCGGCGSGWCRRCLDAHLRLAHRATLVPVEVEEATV